MNQNNNPIANSSNSLKVMTATPQNNNTPTIHTPSTQIDTSADRSSAIESYEVAAVLRFFYKEMKDNMKQTFTELTSKY